MQTFIDQMGKACFLAFPPKRIISLVPSQTELLHYLGLDTEVIGITKFCVHPDIWFRNKTRIGGTKKVNFEKIEALQPQLIIGNKEENQKEQIEWLSQRYPVWMSDITTIADAFEMIEMVGTLTGKPEEAGHLVADLRAKFSFFHEKTKLERKERGRKRAAYFIWKSPYMVAAKRTFIHEMMELAGFENIFGDQERYPEISLEQLSDKAPELILLSSEPYPFQEKHFNVFKEACPNAQVLIVDGELFSWYGSRLLDSIGYFEALHTQIW